MMMFTVGNLALLKLQQAGLVTGWVNTLLWLAVAAISIWVWRTIRKSSA